MLEFVDPPVAMMELRDLLAVVPTLREHLIARIAILTTESAAARSLVAMLTLRSLRFCDCKSTVLLAPGTSSL